jgi:hypothetical protein
MDDRQIQPACAEGRRGYVDDVVGAGIELGRGGAQGDRFADANLAGDDAQQRLADAEADARHGLLVAGPVAQLAGRDGLTERGAGEAEVGDPGCAGHAC